MSAPLPYNATSRVTCQMMVHSRPRRQPRAAPYDKPSCTGCGQGPCCRMRPGRSVECFAGQHVLCFVPIRTTLEASTLPGLSFLLGTHTPRQLNTNCRRHWQRILSVLYVVALHLLDFFRIGGDGIGLIGAGLSRFAERANPTRTWRALLLSLSCKVASPWSRSQLSFRLLCARLLSAQTHTTLLRQVSCAGSHPSQ